jgi:hypothetical protein
MDTSSSKVLESIMKRNVHISIRYLDGKISRSIFLNDRMAESENNGTPGPNLISVSRSYFLNIIGITDAVLSTDPQSFRLGILG